MHYLIEQPVALFLSARLKYQETVIEDVKTNAYRHIDFYFREGRLEHPGIYFMCVIHTNMAAEDAVMAIQSGDPINYAGFISMKVNLQNLLICLKAH